MLNLGIHPLPISSTAFIPNYKETGQVIPQPAHHFYMLYQHLLVTLDEMHTSFQPSANK